ncbi:putative methylase [Hyaloraphidium curvatum]|nr:putative methylase [Hyaloraphidium curvatum]
MLPTPDTGHLRRSEFRDVYEPAEDTFLLLDALDGDADELLARGPTVCVELGCGSGCVSAFLARLLGPTTAVTYCVDINGAALRATRETALRNSVQLDIVRADLAAPFLKRLSGSVDVLLFNPPYVPTDSSEIAGDGIAASWAGGTEGMEVTNRLLPHVQALLSPGGVFYLIAVAENKPDRILETMRRDHGLPGKVVIERSAGRERLSVLRFDKARSRAPL